MKVGVSQKWGVVSFLHETTFQKAFSPKTSRRSVKLQEL